MSRKKKENPFDKLVNSFITEYKKIPNFDKLTTDEDLFRVHTFVATRLTGLYSTRDLVVANFIPAVNRSIAETRANMNASAYKHVLKTIPNDVEDIRHETLRLGYVYMFHKYENLVKSYMQLMENLSTETSQESNETLEEYLMRRFTFNPLQWHKFPKVHKIQFVANCSKHSDGFCKLDNPKFSKPRAFLSTPDDEMIKPSVQEFKEDSNLLITSVQSLFKIVSNANIARTVENNMNSKFKYQDLPEEPLYDEQTRNLMKLQVENYDSLIRLEIMTYQL